MLYNKSFVNQLPRNELEIVYSISKILGKEIDTIHALQNITRLTRKILIFDNIVLYISENTKLSSPIFKRAIGRGKNNEAKLPWGENIALKTQEQGAPYIKNHLNPTSDNRLEQIYYLGVPIYSNHIINGVLVFIRFGGPEFSAPHIQLAEFISSHIGQFLQRKRLQETINALEAKKQLYLLQDEFIASVSHELNTPLGFIKGYTTTLLRENVNWDAETVKKFLTIIDDETDNLSELIDNLLDSSRLQTGNFYINNKPTNNKTFIKFIQKRTKEQYKHLEIQIDDFSHKVFVAMDLKRITQVIDNLVSNAEKYAPKNSIHISFSNTKKYFLIEVKDFGKGISAEHIEHIFKRFYRIQSNTIGIRGSGLGLYICKKIINAHHGKINVTSELNVGTTFTITLPIVNKKRKS